MDSRYLEVAELCERAFAAREKAGRARDLAARSPRSAQVFCRHAKEFETKAVELDRRREQVEALLREKGGRQAMATPTSSAFG